MVQVSSSLNIFDSLTYHYRGDPALLAPGLRVVVPLGNRLTSGWVTEPDSQYKGRVKDILAVVRDDYVPDSRFMAFAGAVANLYFVSLGSLLEVSLPPRKKSVNSLYFENRDKGGKVEKLAQYPLSRVQQLSAGGAVEAFYKIGPTAAAAPAPGPDCSAEKESRGIHRFLIGYEREAHYRELIADCLRQGRSVLITVPDNLTAACLKERLGQGKIDIDIYSSELKPKERDALWQDYAVNGKVGVVVGGLSAVLLPIRNLGLIISERAGSANYKRSTYSRYDIHLLSRLRADSSHLALLEGFSTYTVQAYRNPSLLEIQDQRPEKIPVDVHMIQSRTRGIPEDFTELVSRYFIEKKKVLVVLNKKESVHFLFCEKCKKIQRCPSCEGFIDVDETSHITCRRCGSEKEAHQLCPRCGESLALIEDISIAAVKKLVKSRVVESGITTLSAAGLKEDHIFSVLKRVGESKIVISTPVIINPFFNNMFDAIIYLRPESFFNLEEYDAAEKIFSLAAEFREMVKPGGRIHIFSTFYFHYSLKLIDDEAGFFQRELKYREWFHLPPFCHVYHIIVRGKEMRKLAAVMRGIYQQWKEPLKIRRVYLTGRQPGRGMYKFKGILEAHALPEAILASGLLKNRDISLDLVLV